MFILPLDVVNTDIEVVDEYLLQFYVNVVTHNVFLGYGKAEHVDALTNGGFIEGLNRMSGHLSCK